MATAQNDPLEELHRKLDEAGTVETLSPLLQEIEALEHAAQGGENLDVLREEVLERLQRLTTERTADAQSVLLGHILPLCLRPREEWPGGRSRHWRYAKILRKWLDEFPGSTRAELRAAVLSEVVNAFAGSRLESACATASAVAYRSDELIEALGAVVSVRDDEIGDLALWTRIRLGIHENERPEILAELYRRAGRRWNHSLIGALQELADRSSLDIVFSHLKDEGGSPVSERPKFSSADLTVQIPAAVAERYPQDAALQDQIWYRLVSLGTEGPVGRALSMNSVLAGSVDSPDVIPTHWDLLDATLAERRDIVYYRLEDLVRPRQLLGWERDPGDRPLEQLRRDAVAGTKMQGSWMTHELRMKTLAWETLLSLGRTDLPPLIPPAVEAEINGYVFGEVSEIVACLVVDPLPSCVHKLIAATYTRIPDEENQRLIAHIGAIRIAHSARSEEAFRALIAFGTFKQGVLISLIDALADCAEAMIASGGLDAESILWESTRQDKPSHQRIGASAALARLLRRRILVRPRSSELVALIRDESLDVFARRELLKAAGHVGQDNPDPALVETLHAIASDPTADDPATGGGAWPNLGPVALEALAQLGVLATDEATLGRALGLTCSNGAWSFPSVPRNASSASIAIGILYAADPGAFAPAVATLIRGGVSIAARN